MLDFLCLGAQKAGTTWLFRKLRRHPAISFPGGKEVHFWDLFCDRGLTWYRALFERPDGKLHGDMTPAYATLPLEAIAQCHGLYPDLRLIYTLRNPIDRAWSAAKMEALRYGMAIPEVPEAWFLAQFHSPGSLARGDYEACIRHWRSYYPRDSLLLLRFEELAGDPESYLSKCYVHLGLDSRPASPGSMAAGKEREGPPGELSPALRAALGRLYYSRIRSLAEYLQQDFTSWLG